MSTLVYSPGVRILIDSARHGLIDVSEDITRGSLTLNSNTEHQLQFSLKNERRKYDGAFMPNDRIVVRLKRIRWVQVMAGYLDRVPVASVWPKAVSLHASCSLKRLKYTLYDKGATATAKLLTQDIPYGEQANDGSLGVMAFKALTEIGQWPAEAIHMSRLPDRWYETVSALYNKVLPAFEPHPELPNIIPNMGMMAGEMTPSIPGEGIVGGGADNPSIMGPSSVGAGDLASWWKATGRPNPPNGMTIEQIASWYITLGASEGVRGDLAFAQAALETGNFTNNGVKKDNNFAGVGHYDGQNRGHHFPTPQKGILAQIQLLKKAALGNSVQLANPNVVANWGGKKATYLSDLARNWASDPRYASSVGGIYKSILTHAGKSHLNDAQPSRTKYQAPLDNAGAKPTDPASGGGKMVFPVSGKNVGNIGSKFGPRNINVPGSSKYHKGVDIGAERHTPVLAVLDGVVTEVHDGIKREGGGSADNGGAGNWVAIRHANGDETRYLHMIHGSIRVAKGQEVKAGQQIGGVGSTGASSGPHLHFGYKPGGGGYVDPIPFLNGASTADSPLVTSAGTGASPMGSEGLLSAAMFYPSLSIASHILEGARALMNDESLMTAVAEYIGSSMRDFCSAPNGDFIAWFPDYFGNYGHLGKIVVEPVELLDFTIDWDDRYMVTHQFVSGSVFGYGAGAPVERLVMEAQTHGIATIDFDELIEAVIGKIEWATSDALYKRFGARKNHQQMSSVTSRESEFFFALHLFTKAWAQQFSTSVPVGFMPELWPGMLMQVPSQGVQVYVEQVTHSWDLSGAGFDTTASVMAPASLDGRHEGLPRVGSLAQVDRNNKPPQQSRNPGSKLPGTTNVPTS